MEFFSEPTLEASTDFHVYVSTIFDADDGWSHPMPASLDQQDQEQLPGHGLDPSASASTHESDDRNTTSENDDELCNQLDVHPTKPVASSLTYPPAHLESQARGQAHNSQFHKVYVHPQAHLHDIVNVRRHTSSSMDALQSPAVRNTGTTGGATSTRTPAGATGGNESATTAARNEALRRMRPQKAITKSSGLSVMKSAALATIAEAATTKGAEPLNNDTTGVKLQDPSQMHQLRQFLHAQRGHAKALNNQQYLLTSPASSAPSGSLRQAVEHVATRSYAHQTNMNPPPPSSTVPATPIDMPPNMRSTSNSRYGVTMNGSVPTENSHSSAGCWRSGGGNVPSSSSRPARGSVSGLPPGSPTHSVSYAESLLSRSLTESDIVEQRNHPQQQQISLYQQYSGDVQSQPRNGGKVQEHEPLQMKMGHGQEEHLRATQEADHDAPKPRQTGHQDNHLQVQAEQLRRQRSDILSKDARAAADDPAVPSAYGAGAIGAVLSPSTSNATLSKSGAHTRSSDLSSSKQMLSHTKLCRDRLNNMFERLRETLPPPPPGVDIKHKAQVLDYACNVLKDMVERTALLEAELALSSMRATNEWAARTVHESPSFVSAASKVMSLFCLHREWTLAELWLASGTSGPTGLQSSLLTSFGNVMTGSGVSSSKISGTSTINSDVSSAGQVHTQSSQGMQVLSQGHGGIPLRLGSCLSRDPAGISSEVGLASFITMARSHVCSSTCGIVGRAWSTMRPEWITGIDNPEMFSRAAAARRAGLLTCFAIPVCVGGHVEAVMVFFDKKHRPQDNACMEIGMRLTWALANAVASKRTVMLPQQHAGNMVLLH